MAYVRRALSEGFILYVLDLLGPARSFPLDNLRLGSVGSGGEKFPVSRRGRGVGDAAGEEPLLWEREDKQLPIVKPIDVGVEHVGRDDGKVIEDGMGFGFR